MRVPATRPTTAGAAAYLDVPAAPGPNCYGVRFTTVTPTTRLLLATVQLG